MKWRWRLCAQTFLWILNDGMIVVTVSLPYLLLQFLVDSFLFRPQLCFSFLKTPNTIVSQTETKCISKSIKNYNRNSHLSSTPHIVCEKKQSTALSRGGFIDAGCDDGSLFIFLTSHGFICLCAYSKSQCRFSAVFSDSTNIYERKQCNAIGKRRVYVCVYEIADNFEMIGNVECQRKTAERVLSHLVL